MRKSLFLLTALIFFSNYLFAQNSMVGDGFGGRGWYEAQNYQVAFYTGYTVCVNKKQLYGWGCNLYGELGNGTNVSSTTPVAVSGMTDVKLYSSGYLMSVVKSDNTTWIRVPGQNLLSQLPISNVKFTIAGANDYAFITQDGKAWTLGSNLSGNAGNGTTWPFSSGFSNPVLMIGVSNAVRVIVAGAPPLQVPPSGECLATIVLLADGAVKIAGGGGWFVPTNSTIAVPIAGLDHIVDIKGGPHVAYALKSNGEVYTFGREIRPSSINPPIPAMGVGITDGSIMPPTRIIFPSEASSIVAISANVFGEYCLALDSNHNVYAWGSNNYGQLGDGTLVNKSTPTLVATDVIDIFAGFTFSYIMKTDSTLWASGSTVLGDNRERGSIWMNLPNTGRTVFTQVDPAIPPFNLCPLIVIPIKLESFTGTADGNNAVLNWQSAEEINADKYIVEYSKDGSNFQSIAIINAKGSNNNYKYVHQKVNGTAFYRLKMMDKDGSFTYSEIRVVKFDNKAGFTIAPNPANNVVYFFTKSNSVIKSIQIVSIDGQVVKILNEYNSGQKISISNLARGTYILKAVYKNNEMEYARFIKTQ